LNFVAFIIFGLLFIWLAVLSVKHSTRGRRFFWTVVGMATIAIIMLYIFVHIYREVNPLIFFWLLILGVAVGLFLIIRRRLH